MLTVFAVILCGILTGRLLRGRRLAFLPRLITAVIWLLLFLLGVEVGGDPAVVGGLATLGVAAFVLFGCSVAGSVAASWLLWRRIRLRTQPSETAGGPAEESPSSLWSALKGSLVIVAFFAAGCLVGLFAPFDPAESQVSVLVLYALMFFVGTTLGHDATLASRVRRLDPRLALLPAATAAGTLAGAALAAPFIPWSLTDSLAVGAGFGYYSLSSIFIADLRGPELATVALLCNVMREIFTLLAAPLVARRAGPLAAVSIGGARHHPCGGCALCRGVDFSRLRAGFQRSVSGDFLLYPLTGLSADVAPERLDVFGEGVAAGIGDAADGAGHPAPECLLDGYVPRFGEFVELHGEIACRGSRLAAYEDEVGALDPYEYRHDGQPQLRVQQGIQFLEHDLRSKMRTMGSDASFSRRFLSFSSMPVTFWGGSSGS